MRTTLPSEIVIASIPGQCQIVGVVRHVKDFGLNGTSREQFYFSLEQVPFAFMTITVRPAADAASALQAVRLIEMIAPARSAAPPVPMGRMAAITFTRKAAGALRLRIRERLLRELASDPGVKRRGWLGALAGAAVVLASIGVYGVMAYSVAQQTQEIGIRLALGATRALIMRLVLRRALLLTVSGVAIGLAAALPLARLLGALLFQVWASDPAVLGAAVALLISTGALAGAIPALRAANTDPLLAIRNR